MDTNKVLAAAERVIRAKEELRRAEEDFAAVTSGSIARARPAPKPVKGPGNGGGPSVSQRVLSLITNAGTTGIPRKDIVAVVGKQNETAVHSALKVHQGKGLVTNKDGQWTATKKLVQQIQQPKTAEAELLR